MKKTFFTLIIILAALMLCFGAIITMFTLYEMLAEDDDKAGKMFYSFLVIDGFLLYLLLTLKKKVKRIKKSELEQLILNLAREQQGNLSATVVAADTTLSLSEASDLLERYYNEGICDKKTDVEDNTFIYMFKGIGKSQR